MVHQDLTAAEYEKIRNSVEIEFRAILNRPKVRQCLSMPDIMAIFCKIMEGGHD